MLKYQKIIIVAFAFIVVFIPTAKAWFFVPAAVTAAVDFVAASIVRTQIVAALTGTGVAALVGQRMGLLHITPSDGSAEIRVPLTADNRDRPVSNPQLPSTTAKIVTPTNIKVCPTNYTSVHSCGVAPGGTYTKTNVYTSLDENNCTQVATIASACTMNGWPPLASSIGNATSVTVSKNSVCNTPYYVGTYPSCTLAQTPPECTTGYSSSGTICNLTSPQSVPDSKADIDINTSGSNPVYQKRINDADIPASTPSYDINNGMVEAAVKLTDSQGVEREASISVSPPPVSGGGWAGGICAFNVCTPVPGLPGHYRIESKTNTSSGNAQAVVIDVNKDTGIVTQAQVVPLNGQLLSAGTIYTNTAGQSVAVPSNQLVLATTVGGTYTQAQTNAVPAAVVNFPADLAKTGEAAAAAGTINTTLNEHLTGEQDFIAPAQASINQSYNTIEDSLTPNPSDLPELEISWLPSLMPGNFQNCTPFVFTVNPTLGAAAGLTGVGTIDICDKLGLARALFGWFLGVVTVFFVFRAFIRSNMGA